MTKETENAIKSTKPVNIPYTHLLAYEHVAGNSCGYLYQHYSISHFIFPLDEPKNRYSWRRKAISHDYIPHKNLNHLSRVLNFSGTEADWNDILEFIQKGKDFDRHCIALLERYSWTEESRFITIPEAYSRVVSSQDHCIYTYPLPQRILEACRKVFILKRGIITKYR